MSKELVTKEEIQHKIYRLRGQNVMLDSDLGLFYGEETKNINRVRSRHERSFEGNAFQISEEEFDNLSRFQNVTFPPNRKKARFLGFIPREGLTKSLFT